MKPGGVYCVARVLIPKSTLMTRQTRSLLIGDLDWIFGVFHDLTVDGDESSRFYLSLYTSWFVVLSSSHAAPSSPVSTALGG